MHTILHYQAPITSAAIHGSAARESGCDDPIIFVRPSASHTRSRRCPMLRRRHRASWPRLSPALLDPAGPSFKAAGATVVTYADGNGIPFAIADNVGWDFIISILSFFTALSQVFRVLRGGGGSKEDGGNRPRAVRLGMPEFRASARRTAPDGTLLLYNENPVADSEKRRASPSGRGRRYLPAKIRPRRRACSSSEQRLVSTVIHPL